MKILYVANVRIPTEKAHGVAILHACESLRAAGADVTLVVARRRNPLKDDAERYYGFPITVPMVRLWSLDLFGFLPNKLAFALQSRTFCRSLRRFARGQSREAVVYTRELSAVALANSGFTVVYECHHIASDTARFFARAQRAHKIVAISQALKQAFVEANFASERVLVAPSGVSLAVFATAVPKEEARARLGLSAGFLAVYTGNFTTFGEDKGLGDMLKALAHAPDVSFVAAGGSDEDLARYAAQAQALGVAGRVRLVGHQPQTAFALYQQAADVLVMPFPDLPHYRNHMSPVKMFEYMAADRPIIASDLPTIREVLTEMNAYLIPPDNPAALAAALTHVRTNPNEAGERAAAARTEAEQYSWERRARKVLDFIRA